MIYLFVRISCFNVENVNDIFGYFVFNKGIRSINSIFSFCNI